MERAVEIGPSRVLSSLLNVTSKNKFAAFSFYEKFSECGRQMFLNSQNWDKEYAIHFTSKEISKLDQTGMVSVGGGAGGMLFSGFQFEGI